jgi:small subunit ribosomal protein S5
VRDRNRSDDRGQSEFEERVVHVNRCAKVVKGGRRFSFSALVVVGDRKSHVGFALGKANEVADAIRKATEQAKRAMFTVTMKDRTIPHEVMGKYGASQVMLRPASPGTGVIAGGGVRAVVELSGIQDVLAKSLGASNQLNVVKATVDALEQLRSREEVEATRRMKV